MSTRQIKLLIIFIVVCCGQLTSANSLDEEHRKAVLDAISFKEKSSIRPVGKYIQANMDSAVPSLVKVMLGYRNLSTFILTMTAKTGEYRIFWKLKGRDGINKILHLLKAGQSLVNLQDIVDLNWNGVSNYAKGSFTADKKGFYKIYCRFVAEKENDKWKIIELTIPSKLKVNPT